MLSQCPRCHSNFEAGKVIGDNAICQCGWSGQIIHTRKSRFSFSSNKSSQGYRPKKKLSTRSLINTGMIALGTFAFAYGSQEWGSHMFSRALYNAKSSVKLNSTADHFNMAVICHKLNKPECKLSSLSAAYLKSPTDEKITGEYAIALTESAQHEKAILVYQKFFSMSEGTTRHKHQFAVSLGHKEYYNDAKEYFYQAITADSDNLQIAEDMMDMLTRSHQYGEAMSIIGHFSMTIPKTQKTWHNLILKIKGQYKEYQTMYAIKEMTLSRLGNYYFAPAVLKGAMDMQIFMVNLDSEYTTVDLNYLRNNGIPFEEKGKMEVNANSGQSIQGTRIVIPELLFGAWNLKNVTAVACENCAFVAGKSILSQLSVQTSQVPNTQVQILSMKEK